MRSTLREDSEGSSDVVAGSHQLGLADTSLQVRVLAQKGVHLYIYMHICIYICMYACICIYIYLYVYRICGLGFRAHFWGIGKH